MSGRGGERGEVVGGREGGVGGRGGGGGGGEGGGERGGEREGGGGGREGGGGEGGGGGGRGGGSGARGLKGATSPQCCWKEASPEGTSVSTPLSSATFRKIYEYTGKRPGQKTLTHTDSTEKNTDPTKYKPSTKLGFMNTRLTVDRQYQRLVVNTIAKANLKTISLM